MVEEHVTEVTSYNVRFVVSILPILYKYLVKLKLELYFSIPFNLIYELIFIFISLNLTIWRQIASKSPIKNQIDSASIR